MRVVDFIKHHVTEGFAIGNLTLGLVMTDWALIFQMLLVAVGAIGGVISAWIKLDTWLYERRKRRQNESDINKN